MVNRPWGKFEIIATADQYQIKVITIGPGLRLSDQRHQHRAELWLPIDGDLHVNGHCVPMGTAHQIGAGEWHRLENRNEHPLTLVEIQTGEHFGEDDIERRADDHGRT